MHIVVIGDYDREDRFKTKLNQLVGVGDTNLFHVYLHKESTIRLLTKLNQRERILSLSTWLSCGNVIRHVHPQYIPSFPITTPEPITKNLGQFPNPSSFLSKPCLIVPEFCFITSRSRTSEAQETAPKNHQPVSCFLVPCLSPD
jgi:hypothetical protein